MQDWVAGWGMYSLDALCMHNFAHDIVLISPTVHSLEIMLDVCSSFVLEVDMRFNSSKSVVKHVGARFKLPCKPVMLGDKPLSFVNEAKYLGVCLLSGSKFKVSLQSASYEM